MPDSVFLINLFGGIATRQQLVANGCTGYQLTRDVRSGWIRRVRQARYATQDASADAVAATRVGGLLAGPNAASSYGLWSGFDRRLHVSVGANSSRLRTNLTLSESAVRRITPDTSNRAVVVHWLEDGAVPELGPECWRVTLPVCLQQMVRWSDRETAIACLDTALTAGLVSRRQLLALFVDAPTSDRLIASQARSGSDSGTESLARQWLEALGLAVAQQLVFPGVGRVDLGIVGTRVLIEIDSKTYHDKDPAAIERDRWRDAELAARGYVVIRLSYERVTTDWPWCLRMIFAALAAHPGTAPKPL